MTTSTAGRLPTFDELPHFKDFAGCAWEVWGKNDQLGTVNLLTEEVVKEAAKDLAKEVGGSEEVWNRKLMQNARIGVTQREPNRWNAFVSKRMEDINASQYMALRGYEILFLLVMIFKM